jgi:starch phosphorylase
MDIPGKELIRDIVHFIREHDTMSSMVFLPNYDINVARMMVSGCDVWLNTPRRPREASGTSGMKASMNGLPNLSILDGWWDEADYVRTGWPIGHGEFYEDTKYQDEVEANALYDLMEKEVVPLFYNRDADGIPRGWTEKMKDSIRLNCPFFNTARMVKDYARRAYFPVSDRFYTMTSDNCAPAKELSHWKKHVLAKWHDIKIEAVDISQDKEVKVNESIGVKSRINLKGLTPADVQVELYQGSVDANGNIIGGVPVVMEYLGEDSHNASLYTADITYTSSGLQGLSLRVLPKHDNLSSPYEAGVILWAH